MAAGLMVSVSRTEHDVVTIACFPSVELCLPCWDTAHLAWTSVAQQQSALPSLAQSAAAPLPLSLSPPPGPTRTSALLRVECVPCLPACSPSACELLWAYPWPMHGQHSTQHSTAQYPHRGPRRVTREGMMSRMHACVPGRAHITRTHRAGQRCGRLGSARWFCPFPPLCGRGLGASSATAHSLSAQ